MKEAVVPVMTWRTYRNISVGLMLVMAGTILYDLWAWRII